MKSASFYNKNYYENGKLEGISNYTDYHWMPTRSKKEARFIQDLSKLKKNSVILDFGCAKGYLVKAFRLLDHHAFGTDCSQYAINNTDPLVKDFCKLNTNNKIIPFKHEFDLITANCIFEHLDPRTVNKYLAYFAKKTKMLFIRIPLGEKGVYIHPKENKDASHVIAKNELWWKQQFTNNNWKVKREGYLFMKNGKKYEAWFLLRRITSINLTDQQRVQVTQNVQ